MLNVASKKEGMIGILTTQGYINGADAEPIAERAQELIQGGVTHLVINLEQSRIANSLGISILIEVIEQIRELGGKVAFCHVVPILAKTFQIMGLLKVATVYATEGEAIEALNTVQS